MIVKYSFQQIDVSDKILYDEFLYKTHKRFPFSDIFVSNKPISIPTHKHSDFEARIFVTGYADFNIDGSVYSCAPGTYIEIQPDVPHSFIYSGGEELKVIRFFSNNESWHANYC